MTFLLLFLLYGGVLSALATPVFILARRRAKMQTFRNFVIGVGVVGMLMAITHYTSDRLVAQCQAVGNTQCVDAGSTGMLVLFGIGFAVVAGVRAWQLLGR